MDRWSVFNRWSYKLEPWIEENKLILEENKLIIEENKLILILGLMVVIEPLSSIVLEVRNKDRRAVL